MNRTSVIRAVMLATMVCSCGVATAFAQARGSISGTVKDPTGAVLPGAAVTVTNSAIGTRFDNITNGQGFHSFPSVPVGMYNLAIRLDGFKPMTRTGLGVDADSRLQIDVTLEMGEQSETVNVSADQIHIETVSTQLGEVVSSAKMTTLSLNGRSYTDLLAIQRAS